MVEGDKMNTNQFNPIELSEQISENYKRYLTTTFEVKDKQLKKRLYDQINAYPFSKGPYIETTPDFKKGKSIEELIKREDLSHEFQLLNSNKMPLDRPLYLHQERAVQTISVKERNAVIATGTGSGKTECYLIPILNYLMRQNERGELNPGVRAVLLYPMNALANDQMKRIRELLVHYDAITFGAYTGETYDDQDQAGKYYFRLYHHHPLKNELISRQQMRATPPHILLTNYSMLEYLLLRPKDTPLFDGEYSNQWKFIVLDEAHSYRGAKAIEMAMQMRRLVQRVSDENQIQYIATSATLSSKEGLGKTAEFASKLFGGSDFAEEDIIFSEKEPLVNDISEALWHSQNPDLYNETRELIVDYQQNDIAERDYIVKTCTIFEKHQLPKALYENSKKLTTLQQLLFQAFKSNRDIYVVKKEFEDKTLTFEELEKKIAHLNLSSQQLYSLLLIGNFVKENEASAPLFPVRFHFFIKASEGVFVFKDQDGFHPLLERNEWIEKGNENFKVFELAACKHCGASYLIGNKNVVSNELELNDMTESFEKYIKSAFLILNQKEWDDFKEDKNHKGKLFKLCPKCGNLDSYNLPGRGCAHSDVDKILVLQADKEDGVVNKCHSCGVLNSKGSVIYPFFFSKEAISSILTNVVYQNLQEPAGIQEDVDSDWDVLPDKQPNETKRKLLVFSDNRQDAAFFAPYLRSTYEQILWKRLILFTVERYRKKINENQWGLEDFAKKLKKEALQMGIMKSYSSQDIEEKAKQMVFREFLSNETNALENLGFLYFKYRFTKIPEGIKKPFGENAESFLDNLVLIMRESNIVKPMIDLDDFDDFSFKPRQLEFDGGNSEKWIPKSKVGNKFSDYYLRARGLMELDKLYELIYLNFLNESKNNILKNSCLDYENFYIIPLTEEDSIYVCEKCGKTTPFNYENVCPTKGCSGFLKKVKIKNHFQDDHYRNIYQNMKLLSMAVEEHTAQWKHEKALKTQNEFTDGKINVLSCSTTFELGVDLGDLESVFLKNMPPSPANYVQRAGRAGRRRDISAFVLTYCLRRSHDLSFFKTPEKMINGEMNPPEFEIQNDKIIKRHMYATAFSFFWKRFSDRFDDVRAFFSEDQAGNSGKMLFRDYLESEPKELKQALLKILPNNCIKRYQIDSWGWLNERKDDLLSCEGPLERTDKRVRSEIQQLDNAMEELKDESSKSSTWNRLILMSTRNTLLSRHLISFFSNNNLLPKYGFPVDVVNLHLFSSDTSVIDIELNRDLKIALTEYAPGNSVVAAGKRWQSNYVKKPFDQKHWEERVYYHCKDCGWFEEYFLTEDPELTVCKRCGESVRYRKYIVPEFGFISAGSPTTIKTKKPSKLSFSRRFFSEDNEAAASLPYQTHQFKNTLLNLKSFSDGKLTVINEGDHHRGFYVCQSCGHAVTKLTDRKHKTFYGKECQSPSYLKQISLGYSFKTDILKMKFNSFSGNSLDSTLWYSILYTVLEKISSLYSIDRDDIDGCLYFPRSQNVELIFFDDFPGGAGHVKRAGANILNNPESFFKECLYFISNCECGLDSSCYSCIRSYKNQLFHKKLKRQPVIDFIENEMGLSL